MRKAVLLLGVLCAVSLADEVSAYKAGWVDGFRVGYSLKQARQVDIPAGIGFIFPLRTCPCPLWDFMCFLPRGWG